MSSTLRFRSVLVPLASFSVVVFGSTLLAACGDGNASSASLTSDRRSADSSADGPTADRPSGDSEDAPAPSGDVAEYCARAAAVQTSTADFSDPAAQLESVESLSAVAPPELAEQFDVLREVVDRLSAIDQNDPSAIGAIFAIAFDPEVLAANGAISAFTQRECGMALGGISGSGTGSGPDPGAGADPNELQLEDVDAVKAAAGTQSWSEKLNGTLISGATDVQVSADATNTLTPDEALAACTAMWQALSVKNPSVTVEILNSETVVAASGPDGTCAAP